MVSKKMAKVIFRSQQEAGVQANSNSEVSSCSRKVRGNLSITYLFIQQVRWLCH